MVMYSAQVDFYTGTMLVMNHLRHNGSFCDITLDVQSRQIKAHRCVLAASSQYFHSLFLGQFKEATMPVIDLSEVTSDIDALDVIIDFMYTGSIDIKESNFGVILKLCTFFLIDPLREFCLEYMKKELNLKTCLQFYLYAAEHNLTAIESEAKLIVLSRFHDYLIQNDNLDLSPDKIQFLLNDNIFQHCTPDNLLQFLGKWTVKGHSDQHVIVASQILESMHCKHVIALPCSNNDILDRKKSQAVHVLSKMKSSLKEKKVQGLEKFFKKYQQTLNKVFPSLDIENKTYNLRLPSTPKHQPCQRDKEHVLVTLSPSQCVIDAMDSNKHMRFMDPVTYSEPVFNMCWYSPRTKHWYHVKDFDAVGAMGELAEELYFGAVILLFALRRDELVLMLNSDEMHFYNIRQNSWRMLHLSDPVDSDLPNSEYSGTLDHCYVIGNDDSIYLIMKVKIFEDDDFDDPVGEYFKGYKLNESEETWTTIFETVRERHHPCASSEIQAKISSVSNELLFVCSPSMESGYEYVFVVNLNVSNPSPVTLFKQFAYFRQTRLSGAKFLQTRSYFYIVCDGEGNNNKSTEFKFEYKFNSMHLDDPKPHLRGSRTRVNRLEGIKDDLIPCSQELVVGGSKSMWYFEGNSKSVSFLYEILMNRNKGLSAQEHTPPPFSCISAMYAGDVPSSLLNQMNPVARFMHSSNQE